VAAPELLLQALSDERGTLTWLPNFAYNLLADRAREQEIENVRLDNVRMFINCSEAVRAESHQLFLDRFRRYGADPAALAACYAMAETTFAATQTSPGRPARILAVDRDGLASRAVLPAAGGAAQRLCVSSGAPIEGCEIQIVSEDGKPCAGVGELLIRSRSMFDGYRNDPEATARALRDGWYHSGDLGFRWEGEYYVIGRTKDVIIVAGRNIYPEDVEDAVGGVPGVIAGRAVAFGVDDPEAGTERVCVIAETHCTDREQRAGIAAAIRVAAIAIDVTISDVYLAPPRWLIKSSAGKPGRKANKQRALDGELALVSFEGP
jgi:acyl-CoA synthetase (AMP-forming)/AMP-acid ligase II